MLNLPYDVVQEKVHKDSGLGKEEIEKRVKEKLEALSGLISREGALHIIANELGVKLIQEDFGSLKISQLKDGMRGVSINLKVLDVYERRTFARGEGEGKVKSALCTDETGTLRVAFWNEKADEAEKIQKDDIISLENISVKHGQALEVHVNDRTIISINPPGISVMPEHRTIPRKKMDEITKEDAIVEVFGTILQIYDPYFFEACPHCSRKMRPKDGAFICDTHGENEPNHRGILTIFVDDSFKALRCVLFDDQIKKITSRSMELLRTDEAERNMLKQDLLGSFILVQGRVRYQEQYDRLEIVANELSLDVNPEEEIKKLEQALS
jgi:replication factor A1